MAEAIVELPASLFVFVLYCLLWYKCENNFECFVSILYLELSINIFVLIVENKVKMANLTKLNLKLGAPLSNVEITTILAFN